MEPVTTAQKLAEMGISNHADLERVVYSMQEINIKTTFSEIKNYILGQVSGGAVIDRPSPSLQTGGYIFYGTPTSIQKDGAYTDTWTATAIGESGALPEAVAHFRRLGRIQARDFAIDQILNHLKQYDDPPNIIDEKMPAFLIHSFIETLYYKRFERVL